MTIKRIPHTTPCADGPREFVDIQEALHYHALANGDACWRDLLSHAAVEIEALRHQLAEAVNGGGEVATFALFADGYPAAQGVYCVEHIGPMIAHDASHAGSTNAWKVRPSVKPCGVCDGSDRAIAAPHESGPTPASSGSDDFDLGYHERHYDGREDDENGRSEP